MVTHTVAYVKVHVSQAEWEGSLGENGYMIYMHG